TAVGGYNALMAAPNAQGSLIVGKRFGDKEQLGIMVNGNYYLSDRGSDNWERDGAEIELRDYQLRRTRTGGSATLDYQFNTNNEIYLRGIYTSFTDREWRRRYVMKPDTDDSPFEDHEIERLTKDRFERQNISSINFGGKHTLNAFTIDYEVALSDAFQDTPFDYEVNFIGEPDELTTDFSNAAFPSFTTDSEFDYLDNSNYEFDELETGATIARDRNITGKFNVGIPYQVGGNAGIIKFGAKYRAKTKSFEVTQNKFQWKGGGITFEGQEGDFTAEKFEGGLLDANFLGGQYALATAPDMGRVVTFFNANPSGFELQVEDKLVDEANESYTATEDVIAGYLMTDLTLGQLQIVGGVRYERTTVGYDYNTIFFDDEGDLDQIVAESGSSTYDFILPQLNLRYKLGALTNARAAATYSYARPNFESIVPTQEIDLSESEGTVGNADLQPVGALNLDLMVDHYF
ncbi:MAG TPA: hypothetical protein DCR93_23395, partial [Cytophagales bacterium]|nr:hypothetical protein [Cytophagales bacterium]